MCDLEAEFVATFLQMVEVEESTIKKINWKNLEKITKCFY